MRVTTMMTKIPTVAPPMPASNAMMVSSLLFIAKGTCQPSSASFALTF